MTGSPAKPQGQGCVAILRNHPRGNETGCVAHPDECDTLGHHIRTNRLNRGLREKDVAGKPGIDTMTVNYWETNRNQPSLRTILQIVEFL